MIPIATASYHSLNYITVFLSGRYFTTTTLAVPLSIVGEEQIHKLQPNAPRKLRFPSKELIIMQDLIHVAISYSISEVVGINS